MRSLRHGTNGNLAAPEAYIWSPDPGWPSLADAIAPQVGASHGTARTYNPSLRVGGARPHGAPIQRGTRPPTRERRPRRSPRQRHGHAHHADDQPAHPEAAQGPEGPLEV